MSKTIALVIAHTGFQPVEYNTPKQIILDAGMRVVTVSNQPHKATDKNGDTVKVDTTIEKMDVANYDALIFIGGPGCLENLDNQASYTALQTAWQMDKIVGAICIAPRILAQAGILENKEATGWNEDGQLETIFKDHNAIYVPQDVVVDGRVITATDPHAAETFGFALVRMLG
jgi:protease I